MLPKHQLPEVTKILACPNCHHPLEGKSKDYLWCQQCQEKYPVQNSIPILMPQPDSLTQALRKSQEGYDQLHRQQGARIDDGSYEFFAAVARGNKTLDIACGEGWVEKLAPETVGVDFSLNALKKAKRNGAKHLVCATAEKLPFADRAFDISICAGSLEHFADPLAALREMARVSEIQVLTVHRELPIPFARLARKLAIRLKGIKEQPIEKPFTWKELVSMYKRANLKMIFYGYWSYPTNLKLLTSYIPESVQPPSCFFIISRRK